ncbi:hypothetical protein L489_4943 [Bordetella bronchiseptica 00-P-2730]|nr:hypothetical protein L489_4943 [Bordetella bronchiseptica 00-P-2730]
MDASYCDFRIGSTRDPSDNAHHSRIGRFREPPCQGRCARPWQGRVAGVGLAVADDVDQARAKAARVSQAVRVRA